MIFDCHCQQKRYAGPLIRQVQLHHGCIETAPEGPFDGASCLLMLHSLAPEERRRTLIEVRRRLKPHAPFVVAHLSFPQSEPERALCLSRYVGFAISRGFDVEKAQQASAVIGKRLLLLSPEADEAMLYDASFSAVSLFYVGFWFRVAYRLSRLNTRLLRRNLG